MISAKCKLYLMIISIGFIISCDLDVPIKEMVQARNTIAKAQLVMADKYDPENLKKSVEQLNASHTFIKDKDGANTKKAAETSFGFAATAIHNSLPRAADDTLAEAKAAFNEAGKLNAEEFAPEQFGRAKGAIEEAEKLKGEKKPFDSFMKSKEALAVSKEAKELSLKRVPQLADVVDFMKKEIAELSSQKISEPQKNELADASVKLEEASALISEGDVKQAVQLIGQSKETIDTVKGTTKKQSAKERIAQLRQETEILKKERGDSAGEDIVSVTSMLNEADSLLEQDKVDEARGKIDDAENSLAVAKNKNMKGIATAKLQKVEQLLEETKKKNESEKFNQEIADASLLYFEGKELFESEYYIESLAKLNEAESLINSLSVTREKDVLKDQSTSAKKLEGKRVYKVIYNRKKADCLWRIAHKVYKQARLWPLIYTANRDQIKDPDVIFPGQMFIIPEVPAKKKKIEAQPDKDALGGGKGEPEIKKEESPKTDDKAAE